MKMSLTWGALYSGEGLLFFGNTTIPFVDRFPQNTELYAIMTTRPEDKKQEMNRA